MASCGASWLRNAKTGAVVQTALQKTRDTDLADYQEAASVPNQQLADYESEGPLSTAYDVVNSWTLEPPMLSTRDTQ